MRKIHNIDTKHKKHNMRKIHNIHKKHLIKTQQALPIEPSSRDSPFYAYIRQNTEATSFTNNKLASVCK